MKPDYKNWMPKGMIYSSFAVTAVCLILAVFFLFSGLVSGTLKTVLTAAFAAGTVIGAGVTVWMALMYRAFSYDGKRRMSKQIIEGIARYVDVPEGGTALDVGC
jgi:hypothetical protein